MSTNTLTITFWKLARLGSRAVEVLQRHAHKSAALTAFMDAVAELNAAFHARLTEQKARIADQARTNDAMRVAVSELSQAQRGWLERLGCDLTAFDLGQFPPSDVPNDVIDQSRQLIELAGTHEQRSGQPLPYAEALQTELESLIEHAVAARDTAQNAMAELQEHRRELRSVGASLNRSWSPCAACCAA